MKKILVIVVLGLFLITPSQADDIRDFQIEGMSIGDSLLDYYDREFILDNIVKVHNDNKYSTIELVNEKSSDVYDAIQISFKRNNKKFIIEEITGVKFYSKNINNCSSKMKDISNELKKIFDNAVFKTFKIKHSYDKSGKSVVEGVDIFLTPNSKISEVLLNCINWSKEIENKKGWNDHLRVTVFTTEFSYWLSNKAY